MKLKDDGSFLIGTWRWTHSERSTGWCEKYGGGTYTITPEDYSSDFSVVFTDRNKVCFYENDDLLDEYRVKFKKLEAQDTSDIYFSIRLNHKANTLVGTGSVSKLKFSKFPFVEEEGCGYYTNFFVKE